MSASITLNNDSDAQPGVTFYPALGSTDPRPVLAIRIGSGSIHLDPDTARQLAADIVAALPKPCAGDPCPDDCPQCAASDGE